MGIQLIPGALMVLMVPFVKESPRYLINKGKSESNLHSLCPHYHPLINISLQLSKA